MGTEITSCKQKSVGIFSFIFNCIHSNDTVGEITADDIQTIEAKKNQIFFYDVKKENNKYYKKDWRVMNVCKTSKYPFKDIYKSLDYLKADNVFFTKF